MPVHRFAEQHSRSNQAGGYVKTRVSDKPIRNAVNGSVHDCPFRDRSVHNCSFYKQTGDN
jgi:hypothetical protein